MRSNLVNLNKNLNEHLLKIDDPIIIFEKIINSKNVVIREIVRNIILFWLLILALFLVIYTCISTRNVTACGFDEIFMIQSI